MSRRWIVVLVAILAALLLAPVVALLLAGPMQTTPPPPSEAGAATPTSDPIGDVGASVWWRLGWRALDDTAGPPDWDRLTIGQINGDIFGEVRLGGDAFAAGAGGPIVVGPRDGSLLYSRQVGGNTELHLLNAATEMDDVLVSTPALLHHADLAPTTGVAYFVTGPRNPGVWRVSLDGMDEPELVARLPELAAGGIVLATAPIDALPKQVTLRLNQDESRLAVFTCTATCVLRVIDLAAGADVVVENLEPTPREITDFIDGVVVISGSEGYDADTGLPAPIPPGAHGNPQPLAGWELPPGWRIEERQINPAPNRVPGPTWYVAIGPNGEEVPIEAMGQGIGQG